mgnify:CR=1 FL=1
MKTTCQTARRGISVIEMVITISIGAGLLVVVTMLLVSMLQASAANTQAVARQQELLRLSNAWRSDVHAAREVTIESPDDDPDTELAVVGQVEYLAQRGEIVRTQFREGEPVAKEIYSLAEGQVAEFIVDREAGTATLRLERDASTVSPHPTLEILAAIGLNLRYQEQSE